MPPMSPPLTTQVVLAVLLAASVDVAEDMRQLYAVCDVLLDAGWLTLPEPAAFAESDLQQRLAQLQSTALCYVETKALLAGQPLPACPVGRPRASSGTGQACSGSSGRTLVGRSSRRRWCSSTPPRSSRQHARCSPRTRPRGGPPRPARRRRSCYGGCTTTAPPRRRPASGRPPCRRQRTYATQGSNPI